MNNELKEITLKEFLLWLLRHRRRFRITGPSMMPLLKPGDEVLIDPNAYRTATPRPGDIVVAQHPYYPDLQLVKRIAKMTDDGCYYLEGDNPTASTDSRSFGPIPPQQIVGQVTCRFS
jgi:nickel-type superoxide dismutase maturation protease